MKLAKKLFKRKKLNNEGMTLIEVLVSVIILSLLGGVLLRSFVTSANLNKDAEAKQQTMVLAQSLMESFKSYDMDTMDTQFSSAVANANFRIYDISVSGSKSATTDASGNTVYILDDIEFDGEKYDAHATVVESTTLTAPLLEVADSNAYKDAIFKGSEGKEREMIAAKIEDELVNNQSAKPLDPGYSYSLDGVVTINKRTTTITIGVNTVVVNSQLEFTVNGLGYTEIDYLTGIETPETYSGSLVADVSYETVYGQKYDNTSTGAGLERIYLYYYPMYAVGAYLDCAEDIIQIENNSGAAKDVYLIKQKSSILSSTQLSNGETWYNLKVAGATSGVNLYHNTTQQFASSTAPSITLSGTITDAGSPWVTTTSRALLYDITIDIYPFNDNTTSIHQLKGTVNVQ